MVLAATGSKGKFRCLKNGSFCRGVRAINIGLKSFNMQYKKHIQPQKGPGSTLSFQLQRWTGKAVSPACPKGQEGTDSPSPWHQQLMGKWGRKFKGSQPRPDLTSPSSANSASAGQGDVLQQPEGLRGAGTAPHGVLSNKQGGKAQTWRSTDPAVHNSMIWPLKCKHLPFTPTAPWVPAGFLAALVQPQAGKQSCGYTSSSSASRQGSPFKLQPPLDSIKQLFPLDRTWPRSNAWVRNKDKPRGRRSDDISKLIYSGSALTLKR